jgi:response regulator of citrate/malate metabolism
VINVLIVDDDAMVAELNRLYVAGPGFPLLWHGVYAE